MLVVPIHSMAGVGFPVTVQRNSARWPCWTLSTEGVMVATGWAPSPATEADRAVKHSWKQQRPLTVIKESIGEAMGVEGNLIMALKAVWASYI